VEPPVAALADLAAHPYVLVPTSGDPVGPTRLAGPLPVAEILDLGFGAADALVEVHIRGLAVDGLRAGSLVMSSGEPRLALDSVRPAGAVDQAADVSALQTALAGLLDDHDDTITQATRTVLTDDTVHTAAALRDALAAVRLGKLPPRPPIPSPAEAPSTPGAGPERTGGSVGPAQRWAGGAEATGSAQVPATSAGGSAWWLVVIGAALVVLVLVWLLVR